MESSEAASQQTQAELVRDAAICMHDSRIVQGCQGPTGSKDESMKWHYILDMTVGGMEDVACTWFFAPCP